jgi:hypothetical protein
LFQDLIGWYIGILGVIVGVVGGIFFLKASAGLKSGLKRPIIHLVTASLLYVLFSAVMIFFGITQREITDPVWQVIPILYFISTIFFVVGSINLVKVVKLIRVLVK